ncbi:MAG: cation transporter [Lentisphaeria bacterium]|nr:cation transporter [Lentisphaeria bacterium]
MLTKLLIKLFIPDSNHPEKPSVRAAYGIFSGYVGIAVNVLLFLLKFTVGLLSGSVAIAADAINNLSDAGSSVVTVFGFKLSSKPADSGHPFGHGRIEYVAGVIVSIIIIAMGLDFLKESILRIFSPSEVKMSKILICLVAGSLLFKAWLFFFYRHVGKKINSDTVLAASVDSLSDLISTSVVILAAIAAKYTSFPVDGCAGTIVALLVLVSGIKVLRDTSNPLLGEPPSSELVEELRTRLLQCHGIKGVHDIIMHNYGPNQYFATAHAEVDLHEEILEVHDMLEGAEVEIGKHMPVHLLLHCDPYNPRDPEVKEWRVRMENVVAEYDPKFKLYDFRLKKENGKIILSYHMLIPRNYHITYEEIQEKLTAGMAKYSPAPEIKIEFLHSYI